MWFKNSRNGLLALSEYKYGGKRELWAFHTAKTNDLDAGLAVTGLGIPLDNPYTHRCLFLHVVGVEMFSFSVMPKDRWPASDIAWTVNFEEVDFSLNESIESSGTYDVGSAPTSISSQRRVGMHPGTNSLRMGSIAQSFGRQSLFDGDRPA
jgi:hypothetical protein